MNISEINFDSLLTHFLKLDKLESLEAKRKGLNSVLEVEPILDLTVEKNKNLLLNKPVFSKTRIRTNTINQEIIYARIENNIEIYLHENGFYLFDKIVEKVKTFFDKTFLVSINYLGEIIFNWCYNVVKKGRIGISCLDYLENKLDEINIEHTISFSINNLAIDKFIRIGDAELFYFKKKDLESNYDKLFTNCTNSKHKENYVNKFIGTVFIKTKLKGEIDEVISQAEKICNLSFDVLKLYHPTVFYPTLKCNTEIQNRISFPIHNNVIELSNNNEILKDKYSATKDNYKWELTEHDFKHFILNGFNHFNDFLQKKDKTELEILVQLLIQLFSRALSEVDLHYRAINIASIYDTLFLKEEDKSELGKKTKNRAIFFTQINSNSKPDEYFLALTNIFEVRHKMIHKSVRLEINFDKFKLVQVMTISILLKLITTKYIFNTKDEFINHLLDNGKDTFEYLDRMYKATKN